jgi:multimeric flavodoxin WrbA
MKIIVINGSPRKNWNTHLLLQKCLEGAKAKGAETELINLYDINFKGCTSFFACKLKGHNLRKCSMKDDLEPILQKIVECDALILGSPIYFTSVSGEMKSFLERLFFPYTSYEGKPSHFGKKINTAFIYTMNVPTAALPFVRYKRLFKYNQKIMKRVFGNSETLISTATYQFDDYNNYAP